MVTEICVAVVRGGGRLLVQRRRRGSHLAGTWEFPGGKRRPGERGRACAERETREETGLRVTAGAEILRLRHDYPGRKVRLRFFDCAPAGGALRRSPSLRWVAVAVLRRLPLPPANERILPLLEAFIARAASPPPPPPPGASGGARRGRGTRPSPRTAR